ncbi:USP16_45 [Mytilus coruscus]|uniref:ubiquitinyl hydrolase 1 n=1 Tax=Mytilus coruscus TaxID=42192 RepID=A0A6J8C8M9_MYTCO|nr:USP16_45 [Mytilus coruscus]
MYLATHVDSSFAQFGCHVKLDRQTGTIWRRNYHGGMVKRNDKVTYPETLNIDEFCSKTMKVHGKDQPLTYNLFGVVAHSGNLLSGHYVAYIKTKQRSTASWYDYMKTTWNDPEKCREEVERKLEEFKENESAHECTSNKGFTETTIKMKTKLHSKNNWFYISDAIVRMCKYEEAIDNQNAYVLLYEKM